MRYAIAPISVIAVLFLACAGGEDGASQKPTEPTPTPPSVDERDPAETAATAIARSGGYQTAEEAIAAYAEEWLSPFLGDCDSLEEAALGSCLAADRELGESEATYRLCRAGVDACLLVSLVRGSDGTWLVSDVTRYAEGPGSPEELVP